MAEWSMAVVLKTESALRRTLTISA